MHPHATRLKPIHLLRYGLPGAIAIVGVILFCIGGQMQDAAGIMAVGIALLVIGINVYVRMSIASGADRQREELARENYARTGRWEDPLSIAARPAAPPTPTPAPSAQRADHRADHRAHPEGGASRSRPSERRRPRRPS